MTLDKVRVSLEGTGPEVFGLNYVALSRVRSIYDLALDPFEEIQFEEKKSLLDLRHLVTSYLGKIKSRDFT
jgi:hypothetical protein